MRRYLPVLTATTNTPSCSSSSTGTSKQLQNSPSRAFGKVLYILDHDFKPYHHNSLVTFSQPPSEKGNTPSIYRQGTSHQSRYSSCRGVSAPQNTLPICLMDLFLGVRQGGEHDPNFQHSV